MPSQRLDSTHTPLVTHTHSHTLTGVRDTRGIMSLENKLNQRCILLQSHSIYPHTQDSGVARLIQAHEAVGCVHHPLHLRVISEKTLCELK